MSFVERTGRWFLQSGIQEPGGGVARYYRADLARNLAVSTEITGYAVSTLVYLHGLTGRAEYLERAVCAARFLTRTAWDHDGRIFPFECNGDRPLAYFFDSGIIVRGLLALWRATGQRELRDVALACGHAMAEHFCAGESEFHPVLALPDRTPLEREARWSRSPGCYQLKSALAWYELFEITGDAAFRRHYDAQLEPSLCNAAFFLPGHDDPHRVMDRLHAFAYFLEGMLPCAADPRCAAVIRDGIALVEHYLREIGPAFERSDVYAQLLRLRCYAAWKGAAPMDLEAAAFEAARLASFQGETGDPRVDGGFYFGRRDGGFLPHVNPVSSAFAVQGLAYWKQFEEGGPAADWHALI